MPPRTATYAELHGPLFAGWTLGRFEGGSAEVCVPAEVYAEWKARGFEGAVALEWKEVRPRGAFFAVGLARLPAS